MLSAYSRFKEYGEHLMTAPFGCINGAQDPRIMQFGLKFGF